MEENLSIDIAISKVEKLITSHLDISLEARSSRSLKVAEISDYLAPFNILFEIKSVIEELKQKFQSLSIVSEDTLSSRQLIKIVNQLKLIHYQNELVNVRNRFSTLIKNVNHSIEGTSPHPIVSKLVAAVENRNSNEYSGLIEKIKELDLFTRKNRQCEKLMQKIKTTLPQLYHQLLDNFDYNLWSTRFEEFDEAFSWAKANTWYINFSNTNEKELSKELGKVEDSIKDIISELGSEKAWYSTLSNMTETQRQHLLAWKTAMRKVGKGTGTNAPIYLRDAKFHMSHCRDAIPAWVMPLYRVFETFEMKPNLFDIVIIDEASQSGPEAIILQYLAKKLIVVGDDKQISPEYVGIKKEDVNFLRKQYLYDFNLGDLLDIESSFFDLTNVLFGGRITLREHFRCMPEIIQFSNMISYSHTPLIPLRQYPPNRLEPIISKHIPTGYREGSGQKVMNKPEAEAIVKEIKSCIQNPYYKNKSIGVISLQNKGQAQLIEHMLIKEIGTEEIEKRNIICGDSYDFQGDERDIIFISLVAAPGESKNEKSLRALTTEKDKRRFNVAVSRAKDQLWLFHTPTTNDFRNKECLRYQLISYCQNPLKETLESNRNLCESDFERAVFDQISSKGFKVIPQHKVAGYRIDLVVEGEKGRIAVECDGDEWHGPERYDYDMNRQRILERCGWRFWRVRGSEYYYDPENALNSLWKTLEYYDIQPMILNSELTNEIMENTVNSSQQSLTLNDETSLNNKYTNFPNQAILQTEHNTKKPKTIINKKDTNNEAQIAFFSEELNGFHQQITLFDDDKTQEYNDKIDLSRKVQDFKLRDYLTNKGYEVIDKRENGGALWLIGGKELSPLIKELKMMKIDFTFTENGSRSTKRKAAWFTKTKN